MKDLTVLEEVGITSHGIIHVLDSRLAKSDKQKDLEPSDNFEFEGEDED